MSEKKRAQEALPHNIHVYCALNSVQEAKEVLVYLNLQFVVAIHTSQSISFILQICITSSRQTVSREINEKKRPNYAKLTPQDNANPMGQNWANLIRTSTAFMYVDLVDNHLSVVFILLLLFLFHSSASQHSKRPLGSCRFGAMFVPANTDEPSKTEDFRYDAMLPIRS